MVGGALLECSADPLTGFFRDGCCATGPEDVGSHTVCVIVTEEFLSFSRRAGNDLSTHERALELIEIDTLLAYAIEPEGSEPTTSGS